LCQRKLCLSLWCHYVVTLLAHCAERDPLHQGIIVERATLKQRDFSLNLTGRLGKSQVVTNSTPLNQQARLHPLLHSRPAAKLCLHVHICTLKRN